MNSSTDDTHGRHDLERAVANDCMRFSDFLVIKHVEKVASGRAYDAEHNLAIEKFALKVFGKWPVLKSRETHRHAMDERLFLQITRNYPYNLNTHCVSQNAKNLIIVTEVCEGGGVFETMNRTVPPLDEVASA